MSRSIVETLIGAFVLAIAVAFVVFAYGRTTTATVSGYEISAKFTRLDGLDRGADVKISGIKVGSVVDMELDPVTFRAVARFNINPDYKLPTDSTVSVVSDGLLGGKYLRLEPGRTQQMLAANGTLKNTRDALSLEDMLGRAIFLLSEGDKKEEKKDEKK